MRPRARLWLLVVAACGAIPEAAHVALPRNACPANDCATYSYQTPRPTCQAGACEASQQFDYTLVVSVPETSLFAPGHVFAIRASDLFSRSIPKCVGRTCMVLPALGEIAGSYLVNPAGATLANRVLGNGAATSALPVRGTVRPLWSQLPSDAPSDAQNLGLPLETIFVTSRLESYPGAPHGPGGGPSTDYHVTTPPGPFAVLVTPIAPFDEAFPPYLRTAVSPATQYDALVASTADATIDTYPFPVARDGGGLEGFTVALVDTDTGERVSTIARLHAGDTLAPLRVLRLTGDGTRRLDLKLVPPSELATALPTLSYAFVAGTTPPIRYPALPPLATFAGVVAARSDDDAATESVPATIELASYVIDTTDDADPTEIRTLSFVRQITTDGNGRFSVQLPPGSYKAAIAPIEAPNRDGSARRTFALEPSLDVQVPKAMTASTTTLLEVRSAVIARGTCKITDGRPLAAATVVARPAAVLALPPVSGATQALSPASFPREAEATTDETGAFELALDPGRYDFTIQPAPGTRFPWVISSGRFIGDEPIDLGTIEVPAPINAGLTIRDASGIPIRQALVRAYAVPEGGTVAIRIGEAMTDDVGRFELDLAGTPR